ncbi:hypothetical protein STENM223S_01603 [Streptomyces tendae]
MLNAYMTGWPVICSASRISSVARATRRSSGRYVGSVISSSSLIRSTDALANSLTVRRNSSSARPTFGLTIVPIMTPSASPSSLRVPGTPKAGPGWAATNSSGSSMSCTRQAKSSPSSKRFPAMVVCRVARSVPMFSIGNSTTARAARTSSGRVRDGSDGPRTPSSRTSTTCAACRSRRRGDSPGTATKVPLDCSPAMAAAASSGSIADSR